jgi:hypothetical protein
MLSERQREHAARMLRHLERLSNADVVELSALLSGRIEPSRKLRQPASVQKKPAAPMRAPCLRT